MAGQDLHDARRILAEHQVCGAKEAGDAKVSFLFLTKGEAPKPTVQGGKILIGKQTVSVENGRIVLGARGSPGQ